MIATDLQDGLFGTPSPLRGRVNLGVLDPERVNIVVHGHEPTLSEMIVLAASDPDLQRLAREKGATGINVSGICCTANEILMRHGIPIAGNFLHQELAVMTGAVDVMVVDVQCIMPALSDLVRHFHTLLITTSPRAKIPGAEHLEFSEERALEVAKEIYEWGWRTSPGGTGKLLSLKRPWTSSLVSPRSPCSTFWAADTGHLSSPQRCHHRRPAPGGCGDRGMQ